MRMRVKISLVTVAVFVLTQGRLENPYAAMLTSGAAESDNYRSSRIMLKLQIRDLLQRRSALVTRFIVSECADLDDKGPLIQALLGAEEEFAQLVARYLGDDAGAGIERLSKERISYLVGLTNALRSGDEQRRDKVLQRYQENTTKIVDIFINANPGWQKQTLFDAFNTQTDSITRHVLARTGSNWKEDLLLTNEDYDAVRNFSDMLSEGIIEQFPEKFKN
ncbi:MAG: hypothetical protein ABH865_05935 [Candidatus Omnitrophota bacterium]